MLRLVFSLANGIRAVGKIRNRKGTEVYISTPRELGHLEFLLPDTLFSTH